MERNVILDPWAEFLGFGCGNDASFWQFICMRLGQIGDCVLELCDEGENRDKEYQREQE